MLIIQRPEIEAGEAEGNLQRFTIAPLEPGFGHTLGNSLRRTLLSSIPGASVTQVRFDDALHEFDVIKGVKEDVTDIILNLKDLVLRCTSDEAVTLRLDKRGPAEVRAGDIQTTADVEILNPDLYIATVNATGRLAFDITVEQGRGYLSAERNKRTVTIGVIPVDAIFSPVRRVSFSIEPTRVEQATNFDKLNLEIETDGSIAPRDALASAGDTLRKLVDRATASSGRVSTRSVSSCRRAKTTCSRSRTSVRSRSKKSSRSSTSAACRCASRSRRCRHRRRASGSARVPRTSGCCSPISPRT
jgi:DNA-directed RNA polymerase subunit alpha